MNENFDSDQDYMDSIAEEVEEDPVALSLAKTPEGQGWSLDSRDGTKEPPAILDPLWVLAMRWRVNNFRETGEWVDARCA